MENIIYAIFSNENFLDAVEAFFSFFHTNQTIVYGLIVPFLLLLSSLESINKMIENGKRNRNLAKIATERPRILNEGKDKRILVLGDSTAYGTGADKLEDTLTGRFAHDFPQVQVDNYAVNGSVTKDALKQVEKAEIEKAKYNLVIISTGGNDTWKMTKMDAIENSLRELLARAKNIAGNNVVVIIYNNIASGPVFPLIVRPIILYRTNKINQIFMRVSRDFNIEAVPIFLEDERCPDNFFSHDGLHPSSEGYRIMYIRLWAVLYRRMYDFKLRDY
jgi:lysophospholipase L1-like esterase